MAYLQVHERFRNSVKNGLEKVQEKAGLDHAGLKVRFREVVAGDLLGPNFGTKLSLEALMIMQRRSRNLARFFFGAVAIPEEAPIVRNPAARTRLTTGLVPLPTPPFPPG
jgi:hypothetical protein